MTQQQRLLALLQERGEAGVYVYELIAPRPKGLGLAQYNARIKELREKGYNIINVKEGHFVLKQSADEMAETLIDSMDSTPVKGKEKWEKRRFYFQYQKLSSDELQEALEKLKKWTPVALQQNHPKAQEGLLRIEALEEITNQQKLFNA